VGNPTPAGPSFVSGGCAASAQNPAFIAVRTMREANTDANRRMTEAEKVKRRIVCHCRYS
jgi:ribosomal protein L16/L10AE